MSSYLNSRHKTKVDSLYILLFLSINEILLPEWEIRWLSFFLKQLLLMFADIVVEELLAIV